MARRPKVLGIRGDPVRVVVSRAPSADPSVRQDIDLVKAALLYGDEVVVVSPAASMLGRVTDMGDWGQRDRVELMRRLSSEFGVDPSTIVELAGLLRKKHRDRIEIIAARKFEDALSKSWSEITDVAHSFVDETSMAELAVASRSGLVRLIEMTPGSSVDLIESCIRSALAERAGIPKDDRYTSLMMENFVELLAKRAETGRDYLLVDAGVASLLEAMVREGRVALAASTASRNAQVTAASGLLGRLQTFPSASMSETLDIRNELAEPVRHFRVEMASLTSELETAGYEQGFEAELAAAWNGKVVPALNEIDSAIEENDLRRLYLANTVGVGTVPGLGILSYGLGTGHGVVDLLGVAVAAAAPALRAIWQQHIADRTIRLKPFYFLHLTEQLILD